MTDQEREELIEKMARAAWESDGFESWEKVRKNGKTLYLREARAALAVAEPVIREQAENALREENARLREELQKGFNAMRVFAKYRELEAEIETLRKAVKAAYYEGWQDNASIEDTEDRLHAEWEHSEACAAICEEGKDDE